MTNKEILLEANQARFIDNCIKLSQMVSDGRINSTNAKTVFRELRADYNYWNRHIEKAVTNG